MTNRHPNAHGRARGRGSRPWLLSAKLTGLFGFVGGLFALGAMGVIGPVPTDEAGWRQLVEVNRAVFFPCVFCGLLLAIAAGLALLLRQPRIYLRLRWFRLKLVLLAVFLPMGHFIARGHVLNLHEAIRDGRLDDAASAHRIVSIAYLASAGVFLAVAMLSRHKPRLAERLGSRANARPVSPQQADPATAPRQSADTM